MSGSDATRGLLLLLAALFIAALAARSEQTTPAPLGTNVDPDTYSAARAADHLRDLLADGEPHPVGSAANAAVRERLIRLLESYGLEVTVQQAVGCGFGTCGRVENVLAQLPGEQPSTLMLMAHYDSVPAAPGAGDDGAGVAALLEVARILAAGAPYRNSVLFVFTDGEEPGLLGAEAFFREHPLAERVRAVINLEGSGSSGPVNLLRVGSDSGTLVRTFRDASEFPVALSLLQVLFELMPNNTDFLHAMERGLPGIDFAFAGDRLNYHTPLDSVDNLSRGTLQHHGDNVLPLARRLVNADLTARDDNFVFVTVGHAWWITWPVAASIPLAVIVLVLLCSATVLARRTLGWRQLAGGIGLAVAAVLAVVLLELGAWAVLDRLTGARVAWPASDWPWRLVIHAGAATGALLVGTLAPVRLGFWGRQLGGWFVWGALALVLAILAPLAANVLLVPALAAAAVTVVTALPGLRERVTAQRSAAVLTIAVAGYWMLSMNHAGELVSGFSDPAPLYGPLALLASVSMPLIGRSRTIGAGIALTFAALAAGIAAAALLPRHSPERPQLLNIRYQADADAHEAYWLIDTPEPVPPALRSLHDFEPRALPDDATRKLPGAPAPYLAAAPPELTVLEDTVRDDARHLVLELTSPRSAPVITLALPDGVTVLAAAWEGRRMKLRSADQRQFTFHALPAEGARLELTLPADSVLDGGTLLDVLYRLPPSGEPLVRARGHLGVPVQWGDVWVVARRVMW